MSTLNKPIDNNIIQSVDDDQNLSNLSVIIADSIDRELLRISLNEKDSSIITSNLLNMFYDRTRFALFTTEHLNYTTNTVFDNVVLRDWLFNLTTSIRYTLTTNGISFNRLCIDIANSFNVVELVEGSIVNQDTIMQVYVNKDTITEILSTNPWLVVVFLIMQHLEDTVFYKDVITNTGVIQ